MADFAQMIYGTAQNAAGNVGNGLASSLAQGAQLALKQQELNNEALKLQQNKQQLKEAKVDKFSADLFKVQEFKDPSARKNYMNNVIPKIRDAYGLKDVINDDALKALAVSDENMGRAYSLNLAVQKGDLSVDDALGIMNDQTKFASVVPTPPEMRSGDDTFSTSKAQATYLGNQAKQAQMNQQANQFQTSQDTTKNQQQALQKEKLEKRLNETGLMDAQTDINTLNQGIAGGIAGFKPAPGNEIAGISGQEGKLPASELTGQAAENRQALQRLVNVKLKQMSGSAVMDQELARNLDALGVSTTYLNGSWTSNVLTGLKSPPPAEKVIQGIRFLDRTTSNQVNLMKKAYGEDLFNAVTSETNTRSLNQGANGAAPATGLTPTSQQAAPAAPGAGQAPAAPTIRPTTELENPAVAATLKANLQSNPSLITAVAQRYNMTANQLKLLLGLGAQ